MKMKPPKENSRWPSIVTASVIGLPFLLFIYFVHSADLALDKAGFGNLQAWQKYNFFAQAALLITGFSWLLAILYAAKREKKQRSSIFLICKLSVIAMPIVWFLLL